MLCLLYSYKCSKSSFDVLAYGVLSQIKLTEERSAAARSSSLVLRICTLQKTGVGTLLWQLEDPKNIAAFIWPRRLRRDPQAGKFLRSFIRGAEEVSLLSLTQDGSSRRQFTAN